MSRPAWVDITESSPALAPTKRFHPHRIEDRLIDDLSMAGLASFDAVSFVSPTAVPQITDAADVIAGGLAAMCSRAACSNLRGLESALAAEDGTRSDRRLRHVQRVNINADVRSR